MSLDALIAKVGERLDELTIKPSSPVAVHTLLTRLDGKIREAQEKGYGSAEIVELIVGCGFDTDSEELKKHLTEALENKRKSSSSRKGRTTQKRPRRKA